MRTDDLIDALSRNPIPVTPAVETLLWRALAVTVSLSLLGMLLTLGIREDALEAAAEGWFVWKLAVVALFCVAGWGLTHVSSRPGQDLSWRHLSVIMLGIAGVAVVAGDIADLASMGTDDWSERLFGENWLKCLMAIPLLSALPLMGLVHALRDAAPIRPVLAGAAAGLLASAFGALLYGLHCVDDSPLFLNAWYMIAMAAVVLAGAALGSRFLRW